jgi:hypothetical protein
MAFTLSNLIKDAIKIQGVDAFDICIATGGSATTLVDATLEDKYGDNELLDGTVIVVRTTDGLAPEGEFSRISAYSEADWQATFATLTASLGVGDTCMVISPEYPLRVMIELANDVVRDCGPINAVNEDTTTVVDDTEYSLPAEAKKLIAVYVQTHDDDTNDNQWVRVDGWRIIPSEGNTPAVIVFDSAFDAGHKLQFVYNVEHPFMSAYNSAVNEAISPKVAVLKLADKIMQWYGVTDSNRQSANKIIADLETASDAAPTKRLAKKNKFFTYPKW